MIFDRRIAVLDERKQEIIAFSRIELLKSLFFENHKTHICFTHYEFFSCLRIWSFITMCVHYIRYVTALNTCGKNSAKSTNNFSNKPNPPFFILFPAAFRKIFAYAAHYADYSRNKGHQELKCRKPEICNSNFFIRRFFLGWSFVDFLVLEFEKKISC